MKYVRNIALGLLVLLVFVAYMNPSTEQFREYVDVTYPPYPASQYDDIEAVRTVGRTKNWILFSEFMYYGNNGTVDRYSYYGFMGNFIRK
jgi:hypothetical protein